MKQPKGRRHARKQDGGRWAPTLLLCAGLLGTLRLNVAAAQTAPAPATTPAPAIRQVLDAQVAAWNRGDVDAFLDGYWKSESTVFSGTQGILRGWQALRERYRRSYPDRLAMGTLSFTGLEVTPLCPDAALVLGHWRLDRAAGPIGGVFSLVLRRLPEGWRIIADHTSVVPPAPPAN